MNIGALLQDSPSDERRRVQPQPPPLLQQQQQQQQQPPPPPPSTNDRGRYTLPPPSSFAHTSPPDDRFSDQPLQETGRRRNPSAYDYPPQGYPQAAAGPGVPPPATLGSRAGHTPPSQFQDYRSSQPPNYPPQQQRSPVATRPSSFDKHTPYDKMPGSGGNAYDKHFAPSSSSSQQPPPPVFSGGPIFPSRRTAGGERERERERGMGVAGGERDRGNPHNEPHPRAPSPGIHPSSSTSSRPTTTAPMNQLAPPLPSLGPQQQQQQQQQSQPRATWGPWIEHPRAPAPHPLDAAAAQQQNRIPHDPRTADDRLRREQQVASEVLERKSAAVREREERKRAGQQQQAPPPVPDPSAGVPPPAPTAAPASGPPRPAAHHHHHHHSHAHSAPPPSVSAKDGRRRSAGKEKPHEPSSPRSHPHHTPALHPPAPLPLGSEPAGARTRGSPPRPRSPAQVIDLGTFVWPTTPFPYTGELTLPPVKSGGAHELRCAIVLPSGALPARSTAAGPRVWGGGLVRTLVDPARGVVGVRDESVVFPTLSGAVTLPVGGMEEGAEGARVYTDDSDLGACAVHAGAARWSALDEARTKGWAMKVRCRILPGRRTYVGGWGAGVGEGAPEGPPEDDGRCVLSAGWGNGHDGAGVEVLGVEWVKNVVKAAGRRGRALRMREYAVRRAQVLGLPPAADGPITTTTADSRSKRARSPTPEPWDARSAQERAKRRRVVRGALVGMNRAVLDAVPEGRDDDEEGEEQSGVIVFGYGAENGMRLWFKYEPASFERALWGSKSGVLMVETKTESFVFRPDEASSSAASIKVDATAPIENGTIKPVKADEPPVAEEAPKEDAPKSAELTVPDEDVKMETRGTTPALSGTSVGGPAEVEKPLPGRTFTVALVATAAAAAAAGEDEKETQVLARAVGRETLALDEEGVSILTGLPEVGEDGASVRRGFKVQARRWRWVEDV